MPKAVKPTPARMVLYYPKEKGSKPWPAVVVEVRDNAKSGEITCDLFLFPTRGQGLQALQEDVLFADATPGVAGTCSYPPREPEPELEPAAPPA